MFNLDGLAVTKRIGTAHNNGLVWLKTREDLNAHGRAPHIKAWREYSTPLRAAPTVLEIISDGKVEKF